MTLADHISLSMRLAHEVLTSHVDTGSLMDCAEQHDTHIEHLIEHLQFLDNLQSNQ